MPSLWLQVFLSKNDIGSTCSSSQCIFAVLHGSPFDRFELQLRINAYTSGFDSHISVSFAKVVVFSQGS